MHLHEAVCSLKNVSHTGYIKKNGFNPLITKPFNHVYYYS